MAVNPIDTDFSNLDLTGTVASGAAEELTSLISSQFDQPEPEVISELADVPLPPDVLRVGVYNDLPPGFVVQSQELGIENTIKDVGVRALVSKRSRDDYNRIAFMYFSSEDKQKIQIALDSMEESAKQEFERMFNINNGNATFNAFDNFVGKGSDASASGAFVRFMLTDVRENFTEKNQVVELLQDTYVPYFYGTAPTVVDFSGVIFNSIHDQWKYWFLMLYHKIIKASKLSELPGAPVLRIFYEDTTLSGYPLNLSISHSVQDDTVLPFQMSFLVREYNVERDINLGAVFQQQFIQQVPLPTTLENQIISPAGSGAVPATDSPFLNAALEAAEEFIEDAIEDAIEETGLEAVATTAQDILGSNLNLLEFAENFQRDPVGTIRSVPTAVKDAKSGIAASKSLIGNAKSNPNRVKENILKDNIILGPIVEL